MLTWPNVLHRKRHAIERVVWIAQEVGSDGGAIDRDL